MTTPDLPNPPSTDFVRELVRQDNSQGTFGGRVQTRFPPEPNGYLHIGHAKAICIDFGLASEFGGRCNLRLDDTNPETENEEFVRGIIADLTWLGFPPPETANPAATQASVPPSTTQTLAMPFARNLSAAFPARIPLLQRM